MGEAVRAGCRRVPAEDAGMAGEPGWRGRRGRRMLGCLGGGWCLEGGWWRLVR